ncbi:MAG: family N-acetyltransferase [Bacteroidetes bacterium]|jgi:predicted GNAT family N-acyltransferase|nr:family N-acetyltransferase [Bacteroidota bacterium]
MFIVKESKTNSELDAILKLRYAILRQPWNQPAATATDELEGTSINAFISDDNENAIACGRLQENENKIGQIRFMAVDNSYQGKGLGKLIVEFLEKRGKGLNLNSIELQARENAVKFYESCGYKIKEKSFLLWGQIQHYLMEKDIRN